MSHVTKIQFDVDGKNFRTRLIHYSQQLENFCLLDGKGFLDFQHSTDRFAIAGIGATNEFTMETLPDLHSSSSGNWCFGAMSYELKDKFENLTSSNSDAIHFPTSHFFVPEVVMEIYQNYVWLQSETGSETVLRKLFMDIQNAPEVVLSTESIVNMKSDFTKAEYVNRVEQIRKHIERGDIYEMNFCLEFLADVQRWNPAFTFLDISAKVKMPFSCYYKLREFHVLSFSPERFICKHENTLRSQPMKGTAKRGQNPDEDARLKYELQHSEKERSENVMIVDLVRNDLSKVAERGTVEVEELFGVYQFPQVHQMISSIRSTLKKNTSFIEIMRALFPMGSMTGAPKIRAMELIEKFEQSKRGVYSGSIGCFTPDGDFDFNVIIRSLVYNSKNNKLSYHTGSAITFYSDPELEYEECMLKAKVMLDLCAHSNSEV